MYLLAVSCIVTWGKKNCFCVQPFCNITLTLNHTEPHYREALQQKKNILIEPRLTTFEVELIAMKFSVSADEILGTGRKVLFNVLAKGCTRIIIYT